jgi:tetratricopeptide (TPR) repeat protein
MLVAAWHNNIGENELAIHHATRAVTILRNQAVPMLLALGLGLLASFLTGAGHQEEARNLYQEARDLLRSMSASGGFVVECQVNVKLILEDHFEEIESWALRARSFMGAPERRHRSYALVEGIILVCTAATGRWTKWDEARRNLEKLFRQDTWEHYRLVMLLERTGDIANTAGRPQEAGWAYKLAHRCCLGLRREETSTRLKTKLIAARNMSGDVR